jgi:hypothetical protein
MTCLLKNAPQHEQKAENCQRYPDWRRKYGYREKKAHNHEYQANNSRCKAPCQFQKESEQVPDNYERPEEPGSILRHILSLKSLHSLKDTITRLEQMQIK